MAKEGFDWIWCELALTISYRSSLMEIVEHEKTLSNATLANHLQNMEWGIFKLKARA
jgi:hypothetical protein